ncbi:MAG: hypothetical protein BWY29_01033 [Microgenomates group bacterium ADurb.Bin238]|nr:MAG: hypothetical protein BWY29_01033 [Microgenomates group bacterium ADurb.Bin238]
MGLETRGKVISIVVVCQEKISVRVVLLIMSKILYLPLFLYRKF